MTSCGADRICCLTGMDSGAAINSFPLKFNFGIGIASSRHLAVDTGTTEEGSIEG